MKQRYIKLLLIISLSSIVNPSFSQSPRGRVQIQEGTLVTDQGTLLRGGTDLSPYNDFVWQDIKEGISKIKNLGLNCLHLYAETPEEFVPGERSAFVDSIVTWTRQDSLYLIMTASWHVGTEPNIEFIRKFWQFYAPRYKDETHIIFEICNEPYQWYAPYDSISLAMEVSVYDTIRKYAPETHVLFMSYGCILNTESAIFDIKKIESEIDWNNASIAAHGYCGSSPEDIRKFIKNVQDSGYAITITEIPCIEDHWTNRYANLAFTRVFEEEFISYAHFLSLEQLNQEHERFVSLVESSDIRWNPDFGIWPSNLANINYRDPFNILLAGFCDAGYGVHYHDNFTLWYIEDNAYVGFFNLDFDISPDSLFIECSAEYTNSKIKVHLDSVDGPLIATCNLSNSGRDNILTYKCPVIQFEGIHKIYLVFEGNASILKSIKFKQNEITNLEFSSYPDSNKICFYPNPTHNFITVTNIDAGLLEIYNLQGQLLKKEQLSSTNNSISVCEFSSGSYIVKIISSSNIYSEILIIR